jgi:hypothetical protein
MPNEISATALLQSHFDRIDEEVDRIAMAYCEARLVELAQNRDNDIRDKPDRNQLYKDGCQELHNELIREKDDSLAHILYWLDIRADYWGTHPAPSDDAATVAGLLSHFANEAQRLKNLAQRAGGRKAAKQSSTGGGITDPYRNVERLFAFTRPHRPQS